MKPAQTHVTLDGFRVDLSTLTGIEPVGVRLARVHLQSGASALLNISASDIEESGAAAYLWGQSDEDS